MAQLRAYWSSQPAEFSLRIAAVARNSAPGTDSLKANCRFQIAACSPGDTARLGKESNRSSTGLKGSDDFLNGRETARAGDSPLRVAISNDLSVPPRGRHSG